MKKKGFTLIELIAVLVILAILALIVTPLVMNIIRKARIAADKRSIDAYGRSIELAIATYLLDNGNFPDSISDLTIEYSGDEVVCSTTQLNGDSSVYLSGCSVAGRSLDYTYGKYEVPTYQAYSIGDEVRYNNVDYYVIKDSETNESIVTLLKKNPLTVEEVSLYGGNKVNRYGVIDNPYADYGFGSVQYYNREDCMMYEDYSTNSSGCKGGYLLSDVKVLVDSWATNTINQNDLVEARLIEIIDLEDNLGYEYFEQGTSMDLKPTEHTPEWVYSSNYQYWITDPNCDSNVIAKTIGNSGFINGANIDGNGYNPVVRPVITIKKSALSSN